MYLPLHEFNAMFKAPSANSDKQEPVPLTVDFIRVCAQSLWARVLRQNPTKKEAREKMVQALEWLAKQHGWGFQENVPQTYLKNGLKIAGRIHASIFNETVNICVEVAFDVQEPYLKKLLAAYHGGRKVLLLLAGPPLKEEVLNQKVSVALGGRPLNWIRICQLNAATASSPGK